jgi:hypothetical protein
LLNALITTITLIMEMKATLLQLFNGLKMSDPFEGKFFFCKRICNQK